MRVLELESVTFALSESALGIYSGLLLTLNILWLSGRCFLLRASFFSKSPRWRQHFFVLINRVAHLVAWLRLALCLGSERIFRMGILILASLAVVDGFIMELLASLVVLVVFWAVWKCSHSFVLGLLELLMGLGLIVDLVPFSWPADSVRPPRVYKQIFISQFIKRQHILLVNPNQFIVHLCQESN